MFFRKGTSLDKVKVRIYINDGLAQLASMNFDVHRQPLKQVFARYFDRPRLDHGMTHC